MEKTTLTMWQERVLKAVDEHGLKGLNNCLDACTSNNSQKQYADARLKELIKSGLVERHEILAANGRTVRKVHLIVTEKGKPFLIRKAS